MEHRGDQGDRQEGGKGNVTTGGTASSSATTAAGLRPRRIKNRSPPFARRYGGRMFGARKNHFLTFTIGKDRLPWNPKLH